MTGVAEGPAPAIILVEPQLGENIGTAARAMLNCGVTDLRLVRPRDVWPNGRAYAAASGADRVLDAAGLFPSTEAAVADLERVYATTARHRYTVQHIMTPRAAADDMRAYVAKGGKVGILFGPERTGLQNPDLTMADVLVTVPLNPAFSSLNLAQAVLLVCYEWSQEGAETEPHLLHMGQSRQANKAELQNFFEHLESELDDAGFFTTEAMRPSMVRNLRNAVQRMMMTEQEVRTWHGVIAALTGRRKGQAGR